LVYPRLHLDKLAAMRGNAESYSEVILRLVEKEKGPR
jgi:predicted CopG family antitoxin